MSSLSTVFYSGRAYYRRLDKRKDRHATEIRRPDEWIDRLVSPSTGEKERTK